MMATQKNSRIPPALRTKLAAVAGAGTLTIALTMGHFFEGRRYTVYLDPVGIPTVCDGITGPDVVQGKTYTDAECDALSIKHLAVAEQGARKVLARYPEYNKWRQAALLDFTYNAGVGNLATSTMAKKFNAGDDIGGCMELARWVKAKSKGVFITLKGLVTRRGVEEELCLNGFE
jgi:lysozyme